MLAPGVLGVTGREGKAETAARGSIDLDWIIQAVSSGLANQIAEGSAD